MAIEHLPPRSSLSLGWIIALSGFGLLVTIVFAVMMIRGVGRRFAYRTATRTATATVITAPRLVPMRETEAFVASSVAQSGETALNASNADQVVPSGNETTFIKTFALDNGAAFSLKNMNGSITVTAWDQPKAEVKAIQSGSDHGGRVFFTDDPRNLSIRTAQTSRNQEVRFEVRLPTELSRIELNSVNGSIEISRVTAAISVQSVNGAINLVDVSGVSKVQTANGNISALLRETGGHTMEFGNANGNIELTVTSDFVANLEVSTVHGSINIGDQFGITVQKEVVGQRARGQIGSGGQLLKITTVNGNIKVMKGNVRLTTVNGSINLAKPNPSRRAENGN